MDETDVEEVRRLSKRARDLLADWPETYVLTRHLRAQLDAVDACLADSHLLAEYAREPFLFGHVGARELDGCPPELKELADVLMSLQGSWDRLRQRWSRDEP